MTLELFALLKVSEVDTNVLTVPVCAFFPYKKNLHITYVSQPTLLYNFKVFIAIVKVRSVK